MEKKLIEMQKLARPHYLKHYLGGECLVMDPSHFGPGIIEQVDIEDNSVLVKQGELSHWIPADRVVAGMKKFKHLNTEDLQTILANVSYKNHKLPVDKLHMSKRTENFVEVTHEDGLYIILITKTWGIYFTPTSAEADMLAIEFPDNNPSIIFLLCEMGYDVTNIFD